jgi:NAD(P)-dependent dehydrogenase (short-subunit alcohol dehydrogenase family)
VRTVLITGTSRGFGQRIAVTLAGQGWHVYATMREPARSEALAEAARQAGVSDSIEVVALDVTDADSIASAREYVLGKTGGTLDAFVSNAGTGSAGLFEHYPAEEFRRVLDTNFHGAVDATRAFVPALRRARGRLVVVSSNFGFFATPSLSAYHASKFALEGWAEALWYELGPLGVRVTLIEPAAYATDLWDGEVYDGDGENAYGDLMEKIEEAGKKFADKSGDPQPVADLIASVLEKEHPRLRYTIGMEARAMSAFKGVLPYRLRAAIVRQQMGLTRWKPPV